MKKTQIIRKNSLPFSFSKEAVIIYDRRLLKVSQLQFRKWIKRWQNVLSVEAGEELKSLESFSIHMKKVLKMVEGVSRDRIEIVVIGGGSLGDFGGFIASVLKRGVKLTHVPTTWLAAIDSSHGGKTALNLSGYKNQIGTFYPADKNYLVKELLQNQPLFLAEQALSELVKVALIQGGAFWKDLCHSVENSSKESLRQISKLESKRRIDKKTTKKANQLCWHFLEQAIQVKMKWVAKDPYEQKGLRHVLNFGHTWGHFVEAHYGLSHGESVAQGLFFAICWSRDLGVMKESVFVKLLENLEEVGLQERSLKRATSAQLKKYLQQDKKIIGQGHKVNFVFIERPGKVFCQKVSVEDIVKQALRMKRIR